MPLKTSFFNKGIFFNNIKRFWLITFSYTLFLLIFVMGYLNSAANQLGNSVYQSINLDIFSRSNAVMVIFLGFYSLISGLAVFSYMHFQKNTAMVHSLPLRRETLFVTNYLSGLFLITFPLVFNSLVLIFTEAAYGLLDKDHVFLWLGVNFVITFLLYTFTVFAGMFTGHMAAQTIFYLIYSFLAIFLEAMVNNVLQDFLFGYIKTGYKLEAWSPLFYITEQYNSFSRNGGNLPVIIGYIIAGIIFLASAFVLYRRRHMEVASDVISFQVVKPIFKYVVAFCASALLGSLLVSVLDIRKQFVPYILTYLFGGFIGYFASEMLVRKTFRVFKAYKGFLAYAVVLILLFCSVNFDFFGYEKFVPKDSEIELMYMSQYQDAVGRLALRPEDYNPNKNRYMFTNPDFMNNPPAVLSEAQIKELRQYPGVAESREAITKVRIIHDYIVKNEASVKDTALSPNVSMDDSVQYRIFYFVYRLKNGTLIERQYYVRYDRSSELEQLLKDYVSLPEIKEKYRPILTKEAKDIRFIAVAYNEKGQYTRHEIADVPGFLAAYKKDILTVDPLDLMYGYYNKDNMYNIDLTIEFNNPGNMLGYSSMASQPITTDYKNTLDFLIKSGMLTEEQLSRLKLDSPIYGK